MMRIHTLEELKERQYTLLLQFAQVHADLAGLEVGRVSLQNRADGLLCQLRNVREQIAEAVQ